MDASLGDICRAELKKVMNDFFSSQIVIWKLSQSTF
jgi:hypothetical protein